MTKIPNLLQKDIEILIVEDEMILAMGIKCTLNKYSYEVCGIETSANDAIEHVKRNRPDLVFMDIHLKDDSSGINAAKFIWQYYKVPIIFLTSYTDDKTIKEAMQSEPYAYLVKPYKEAELKVAVETTLNKHNYFYKNKDNLDSDKKMIFKLASNITYNKTKSIVYKDGELIKLTGNEIKFLEILSDNVKEPVCFDKIFTYIWRDDYDDDLVKLRSLIFRLKQKLQIDFVENIFDLGYKLKVLDD